MNFIPQRSIVLESGATPEQASARLRQLLDAPKPACEYCGRELPAHLWQFCMACGHASPGRFSLGGTVSPEGFHVRFSPVRGILVFQRKPDLEISGRFEAAPVGTRIPVIIEPNFLEYMMVIPGMAAWILIVLAEGIRPMAMLPLVLVWLGVYWWLRMSFRLVADRAQEILTVWWGDRVPGDRDRKPNRSDLVHP